MLLLAAPVSAQNVAVKLGVSAFVIADGADLATSMYAFGKSDRFREVNPILRPLQNKPVAFGVVKMGIGTAVSYLLLKMGKNNPKAASVVAFLLAGAAAAVAAQNARQIQGRK